MKRKIASIAAVILSAIIMITVPAGCGVNSSAENAAVQYVKATISKDYEKLIKCIYYKDSDGKNAAQGEADRKTLERDKYYSSYKVSFSKVSYTQKYVFDEDDLEESTASYGEDVTDGEFGTVKFNYKITYKLTADGKAAIAGLGLGADEGVQKIDGVTMSVETVKIGGKWYVEV